MAGAESYDVVVLGGRIAGVVTAGSLARRGYSVLLVDRATFPSSTLSTHFFRGNGLLRVVDELGWLDDVLALGAPQLACEYGYADGGTVADVGPPQDPGRLGYCMSVRRITLDAALLRCLGRSPTARVRTGCGAADLLWAGQRVVGARLSDGTEARARLVVGADGRRSKTAERVCAADRERHEGVRALYYRYLRGFSAPSADEGAGPEFSTLGDEMAYVFPSDAGVTCVAVSVNAAEYGRFRHDPAGRWESVLRRHGGLWPRIEGAQPDGRILGSGLQPDFVRRPAGPGWALVGDAALHQDPWSGAGMDSAAVGAELLADTAHGAWSRGDDDWADEYERRRDAALLETFHETVGLARDLSRLSDAD